ncbi:MAG: hypothetical protein FYV88_2280, partial [Bacteroidetes bacterium]|nr:hypothetical protein [Bacteroidota bacterium]
LEEIKITDSLKYYLFNNQQALKNENQYINQIINAITLKSNPIIPARTYHVSISKKDGTIYSASKGDLYSIRKSGITKILFKNQSLAAQSLAFWKDNLLIGTLNKGLLMLDQAGHFTELNKNAKTNNKIILDCKVRNDTAFIYEPGYIELIDLNTNISIQTITIPPTAQGSIYNFIIENDYINITTSKKVYNFKLVPNKIKNVPLYILEATYSANGNSNMLVANIPDNAEFIEVRVSSPYYNLRDNINIQYTLKYSGNEKWESIPYTNKPIRLYPTKSGDYEFICRLQMNDQSITDNDIKLKFNKKKAYWQTALFISTATICILLIIYSLYKRTVKSVNKKNAQLIYQLNLENQLIESSITSIKAQMNPHFIFNALNTIQSFIYNNEKNNASNYLGRFSGLIRSILDFSQKSKIPLNEEINLIENYCFLESKRFIENELIVTIEIEKNIETETIQIPPLLIQPFIENSFKHGLFHKEGQKTLLIHLKMEEALKKLIVTIDDNGIGRVLSREINKKNPKQSGFGIKANEKRIELINKIHPGSVSICFTDKYDDNGNSIGTKVIIEILTTT